jgi:hypothetical protein
MTDPLKPWDAAFVRKWLDRRYEALRLDQAAADRRGYEVRDDSGKAAAEGWARRALKNADCTNDQAALAAYLKRLIGQVDYCAMGSTTIVGSNGMYVPICGS